MRLLLGLWVLLAAPLAAEDLWVLQTGPEAVDGIPLDPVQPVPCWRGLYGNGEDKIWVYATSSPHFFAPATDGVRRIAGTPWTVVVFYPADWKAERRSGWLNLWSADFTTLQSLPDPGWPIVLPSVLRNR